MLGQCYLSSTEECKDSSFLFVPKPEDPEWIQFGCVQGCQIVKLCKSGIFSHKSITDL